MAAAILARPDSFHRQQRLLHLDCSADLRSYSRNLGPGVQEKIFERTSDALRTQLEEHRDFLLQHQHQQHGQGRLDSITRSHVPYAQHVPQPAPARLEPSPYAYIQPSGTAAAVASASRTAQTHAVLGSPYSAKRIAPRRPQNPIAGDIATYPRALREALERCLALQTTNDSEDTVYHVIIAVQSTYMDDSHEIVGTYTNLREANEKMADMFLFNGDYASGIDADETPEYDVKEGGLLSCAIMTDGSTGGYCTYYVQRARLTGSRRSR